MKSARFVKSQNEGRSVFVLLFVMLQSLALINETCGQQNPFAYHVGFQQNLNSYYWLSRIDYNRVIFDRGFIELQENFNSSLIRLSRTDHKWKDDQQFSIRMLIPASSRWGVRLSASSHSFTDRLSGLVNDVKTNWSTIGFLFQPLPKVALNSDLGYKYDDRLARIDRGFTYNVQLKTDSLVFNDYENRLYFLNKGDQYSIRSNRDLELQYNVKKHFQYGTVDSFAIYYSRMRRDNYDQFDIDQFYIETLAEENRGFQNSLIYGIRNTVFLGVNTKLNQRSSSVEKNLQRSIIDARSKRDFQSENELTMSMNYEKMILNLALKYESNNQKNDVPDSLKAKKFSKYFYYISPDFQSSRLTLSALSTFYLFKSDTLHFNGSISRFSYDTPENNMDDRDEFRLNLSISEIHPFAENLILVFNGSVNLYHLVYIFSERSANNNWMRIFRLFPQVFYRPNDNISIAQYLEILANYVDYDYETGATTTDLKSYIFRRFSFTQEMRAQISLRADIFLNYKLELEENGKLDWDRWTEYLLMHRKNQWLRFNFNFKLNNHFMVSPGFILHNRAEERNNLASFPGSYLAQGGNITSFGPTFKFVYHPHHRLNFSLQAIRRAVTMVSEKKQFINHIDLSLSWYN